MEKSNPETAPQATLAQSPAAEPPAYYANPTTLGSPAPQSEIQLATPQQQPAQQDPIQQQPLQHTGIPDNYASKQAEAMNPNAVPLVTPVNMLQGETPQYIDCPWCYQRALVTTERHGSSMQMLTGLVCCLICVCLACVPCIAGWFEETEYRCSACKKLVAKRDDNGAIHVHGPPVLVPSNMPAAPQPVHPAPAQQQQEQQPPPKN